MNIIPKITAKDTKLKHINIEQGMFLNRITLTYWNLKGYLVVGSIYKAL